MIDNKIIKFRGDNYNEDLLYINWYLTKNCSYDCEYCSIHDNSKHQMVTKENIDCFINHILLNSLDRNIKLDLFGGEPTINPNFIYCLEKLGDFYKCHKPKSFQVSLYTNGSNIEILPEMVDILNSYSFEFKFRITYHPAQSTFSAIHKYIKYIIDYSKLYITFLIMYDLDYISRTEIQDVLDMSIFNKPNITCIVKPINRYPISRYRYNYSDEDKNWLESFREQGNNHQCELQVFNKNTITNLKAARSTFFSASNFKFKGSLCYSNLTCRYVDVDGTIYSCFYYLNRRFLPIHPSIYNDKYNPKLFTKNPILCLNNGKCICDYASLRHILNYTEFIKEYR